MGKKIDIYCDRYCGRSNRIVLVYHMISQDLMTKGWNNIMGRSPSCQVTILTNFVAIGTVVVEI